MARYNNAPYIQIDEGDCFGEIDIVLKNEEIRAKEENDSCSDSHFEAYDLSHF